MNLSLSLDFTGVFDLASGLVSGLFPIFQVPIALGLGIGILGIITAAFSKIIKF